MEMRNVSSSNISAIGYDPETKTLAVQFSNSGTYHYHDVPPDVHESIVDIDADGGSIGRFFAANIRNQFRSTRFPATEARSAAA